MGMAAEAIFPSVMGGALGRVHPIEQAVELRTLLCGLWKARSHTLRSLKFSRRNAMEEETILDAISPEEFQARFPGLYGSSNGVRWEMRQNRTALIEAGAIVLLAGRWKVIPKPYLRCVTAKAKAAAQARLKAAA